MTQPAVLVEEVAAAEEEPELGWLLPSEAGLPQGWKLARLRDICEPGARSINPMDFPDEVFEYYSIPAFQESAAPAFERGQTILSNKLLVQRGSVLFGKLNPRVLKVWQVNVSGTHRAIASTEFLPLVTNSLADAEFTYFLCQTGFVVQEARR